MLNQKISAVSRKFLVSVCNLKAPKCAQKIIVGILPLAETFIAGV